MCQALHTDITIAMAGTDSSHGMLGEFLGNAKDKCRHPKNKSRHPEDKSKHQTDKSRHKTDKSTHQTPTTFEKKNKKKCILGAFRL